MKCFYHNDLDGRCAGAIVAQYTTNKNPENYFEVDYVMPLPIDKVEDGEYVYFVDYSFKENTIWVLKKLLSKGCRIVWIDHHTSSINLEAAHPELSAIAGIRSDSASGAALTYMYLFNKTFDRLPLYVQLVSDYDCWHMRLEPNTTYFKLGIEAVEFDALDAVWGELRNDDINIQIQAIIQRGRVIKNYVDENNKYYRDHYAYESTIAGYKCLVVNKKSNSWVFGDKYKQYPLCMVWVFDGAKYTYSIFASDPDVDCSKIAESYGGGGHKGTAGFSSDKLLFKKT